MTKEVLDAGVVVIVLVAVVAPLVAVLGLGLRVIGKAGLAMADALESLRVSNDKQNQVLQDLTTREIAGLADVKNLSTQLTDLTEKIHKLPPDIQKGVTEALDSFLDRLGETLKRHNQVPPDFRTNGNEHNSRLPFWVRLLGM